MITDNNLKGLHKNMSKDRFKPSQFLEIRTDYMDNKGVIHIDGYKTLDDNEEGTGIGYFIHGEVYWRDAEYQFDPLVKAIVKELKENQKPFILDNINYAKLKEQKKSLIYLEDSSDLTARIRNDLRGIIYLLDNIQDYAVDVLGKSEDDVFDFEEDAEELGFNSGDFFKLLEDYDGFKEGAVLLLGNLETMEYFDITTEMTTGNSYSAYNLPPSILEKFEPKQQNELTKMFRKFVEEHYKINKDILKF